MENSNICVIKIPGEEKEWGRNYFPKLTKDIKPQIQEVLSPLSKKIQKQTTLRHIILRLLKIGVKGEKS